MASSDANPLFKLQPLLSPDKVPKQYHITNGYAAYLADYKLYLQTLADIKQDAHIASKMKTKVSVQVSGTKPTASVATFVLAYNNRPVITKTAALVNPVVLDDLSKVPSASFSAGPTVSFDPALVPENGSISAVGHTLAPFPAGFTSGWTISRSATVEGTASVAVEYGLRKKGPVQTPKKIRTPEELAARAEKEKQRKANAAWFADRKLDLAKGKLEEKLATSLQHRASLISKSDHTVEVTADLDGWRVVTHKRSGAAKKVRTVRKTKGGQTTITQVIPAKLA